MFVSRIKYFIFHSVVLFAVAASTSSCKHHKAITASTEEPKNKTNPSGTKKITAKYAVLLNTDENKIDNIKLYTFIDEWYGVPYKYGGKNKSGIDCSNFTCTLYSNVYSKTLSGTSSSLYEQCNAISKSNLNEGDLIFFKIDGDKISHVGIYLQNNKFVHATTKKGVMIDDLDEPYYKKYYYKSGRPE